MTAWPYPQSGAAALKAIARRQGEVTNYAFRMLGGRDQAVAFLNNEDASLGARPIDLASASDEGCMVVQRTIHQLASPKARQ